MRGILINKANQELSIDADLMSVRSACGFVKGYAQRCGLSEQSAVELELAVDEICTNIVIHGYQGSTGTIDLSVDCEAVAVRVAIMDSAKPFNPVDFVSPDVRLPLSEREIGHLGILIARNMVDDIAYEVKGGKNKLTITKLIKKRQYV